MLGVGDCNINPQNPGIQKRKILKMNFIGNAWKVTGKPLQKWILSLQVTGVRHGNVVSGFSWKRAIVTFNILQLYRLHVEME